MNDYSIVMLVIIGGVFFGWVFMWIATVIPLKAELTTLRKQVEELEKEAHADANTAQQLVAKYRVERDRYLKVLEEIKSHKVGVCESPKYVQASMYHKFKDIATDAIREGVKP